MPATATRRVRKRTVVPDIATVVREYLLNRSMRERSLVHENTLKAGLMQVLESTGTLDEESGHRSLLLDEPLSFTSFKGPKGTEKVIKGIQRTKRKGAMTLNEERTMAYLAKRKLLASCTATVTVIDEDAILAANFKGVIPDEDLEKLYDESDPTYAFNLLEG
jgi:hypothetical protein